MAGGQSTREDNGIAVVRFIAAQQNDLLQRKNGVEVIDADDHTTYDGVDKKKPGQRPGELDQGG